MKPGIKAGIVVAIILLIGAGAYMLSKEKDDSSNTNDSSQTEHENTPEHNALPGHDAFGNHIEVESDNQQLGAITAEQVATHTSKSDCWTIIDGSVYDITSYVNAHPGGDNILSACGVDATAYFNGDKKGQEGGTNDHTNNSSAKSQLSKLKIGELAN